jgi:hypothetical protein
VLGLANEGAGFGNDANPNGHQLQHRNGGIDQNQLSEPFIKIGAFSGQNLEKQIDPQSTSSLRFKRSGDFCISNAFRLNTQAGHTPKHVSSHCQEFA